LWFVVVFTTHEAQETGLGGTTACIAVCVMPEGMRLRSFLIIWN